MNDKDTVAYLRERLSEIDQRTGTVSAEWLHGELTRIDRNSNEISEMQKYEAQLQLEDRKAFLAGANESFKAALDYAKVALNTAFLVNGGGAVAMLAFISNQKAGVSGLAWSIVAFALGALFAAAATGCAFFAQE